MASFQALKVVHAAALSALAITVTNPSAANSQSLHPDNSASQSGAAGSAMTREELTIAEKVADQNNLPLQGLDVMKTGNTITIDFKQTKDGQADRHVWMGSGFRAVIDNVNSAKPNVLFVNYDISLIAHKGERGLGQVHSVITSANGDQNLISKLGEDQGPLMTPQALSHKAQQENLNLDGKQQLVSRPIKVSDQLTADQGKFAQGAISAIQEGAGRTPQAPKSSSKLLVPSGM